MKFYSVTYRRPNDRYPHTRAFFGKGAKEAAALLLRELQADEHALGVEMVERTRTPRTRTERETGRAA